MSTLRWISRPGRVLAIGMAVATLSSGIAAEGARAAYEPARAIGSGFIGPNGVAVDAAGDVFVADPFGDSVVRVAPDGTQTSLGSGLNSPTGVAVDSAGDVFIADFGNNRVVKVTPSGTQTTVGTGLFNPAGVAVDSAGDVFIADYSNSRVVEVTPSGTQTTVESGIDGPLGVAVDDAGDVYIAESGDNQVVEVTPSGTQTVVASGLDYPTGVAVDGAGDLLITEFHGARVVEVTPSGNQSTVYSDSLPFGVAIDRFGNLFIADQGDSSVIELPQPDPTTTQFGCGPVAKAGVAQKCTVLVSDSETASSTPTGTVQLTASGAGTFGDNTSSCTLVAGRCYVTYTPSTAGTGVQTITAAYQGDSGHASSSTSSRLTISALSDTVSVSCPTPTTAQIAKTGHGKPVAFTCVATVAGPATKGPQPTGTVSFSASPSGLYGEGLYPATCTLKSRNGASSCSTTFETASQGNFTITAAYAGDQNYEQGIASATLNDIVAYSTAPNQADAILGR